MTAASAIAVALGGRQGNSGWWSVTCPVCQSEKLGLKDCRDGLIVNCFKGCSRADILAELQQRGLCDPDDDSPIELDPEELARRRDAEEADRARRIAEARWIWQEETFLADGTAAHTYLASRLILLDHMPETIRFRHGHARRNRPPSMVARVDHVLNGSIGVHLTHLTYDGCKADVDPVRQCIGACAGGAVHFGEPRPDRWLAVGEGVETTLTVMQSGDLPGWAALSATGIENLILPPQAKKILIAADNDENGTGGRAANHAARRWRREGRDVKIIMPPKVGFDWNDILLEKDRAVRCAA
jgi:hypothetical protein